MAWTLSLAFGLFALPAQSQTQSINLYTTREPGLIQPLLEAFSTQTGIRVATVFLKDGLLERVKAEGTHSPADVLMVVDIGNLFDLVEANLFQPIQSEVLTQAIPILYLASKFLEQESAPLALLPHLELVVLLLMRISSILATYLFNLFQRQNSNLLEM
jgi:ABC-type thiamine transport system substrate-binding protein